MDTLARTKKLEALGFDRPRAEGLVQMVKQSIDEEVAKKSDLIELKAEIKLDIALMKNDIADMKVEIGGMKGEIVKLGSEIKSLSIDLQKKLGGLIIVLWGLGLDWGKGYELAAKLIDKILQ